MIVMNNLIWSIDQVASQHPTTIAYDEMGRLNTYQDLKNYSDALATWLDQNSALDLHQPILFYGDHQFTMVAGFIGSLKAGHSYIPVETGTASTRLASIIETGQPGLVVAIDDFPAGEVNYNGPVLTSDQLTEIMHHQVNYQLDHVVDGDQLFYILFTSGTTGSPKGVEISHDNINSFARWMLSDDFKIPQGQTFLGQPPYSFDLSGMFWLPALLSGGTIRALPSEVVKNFGQLFTVLPSLDLNVYVSTPSLADMLMLSPDFSEAKMPGLTHFLFCGEELTVNTAKRLKERFPHAHIFNTYGPTEAAVAITSVEITQEMVDTLKRLPVGKVKANTTTSIWDGDQEITTPKTEGELVITGDSVARGYLNNPTKTQQNFFKLNGIQSYRTGDAAMIDEDGMHYIVGRMDFQIKLHGFRIELDEVRSSIETSPLVKQAVAVPKYDANHRATHLIAYIIPNDPVDDEAEFTKALRNDLKDRVMEYMMPTQFVYVDDFPKSANGKIAIKQMIAEANQ